MLFALQSYNAYVKHHKITHKELAQAQLALLAAIILQIITRHIGNELLPGSQYLIILTELALAALIGFTVNTKTPKARGLHHLFAVLLLGIISVVNISGLGYVLHSLVTSHGVVNGEKLLASAVAIFITNIIVFALWYWEIDSPGLTRTLWSKFDKDFQFTQQDVGDKEFPGWQPQFVDYLYLSVTNAVNFAPADARPLTHQAKLLMAAQSLVSVFTLALVIARSVSILGA
jgi:uncharacterized membrane protein